MSGPLLLDTCAALWVSDLAQLTAGGRVAIDRAEVALVCPITAWEVGLLVSRGRMPLAFDPLSWFERLVASGAEPTELSPAVLIASSFLPGAVLRDPSDRIIVATARTLGVPILTRDRAILDYAAQGHVRAIPC